MKRIAGVLITGLLTASTGYAETDKVPVTTLSCVKTYESYVLVDRGEPDLLKADEENSLFYINIELNDKSDDSLPITVKFTDLTKDEGNQTRTMTYSEPFVNERGTVWAYGEHGTLQTNEEMFSVTRASIVFNIYARDNRVQGNIVFHSQGLTAVTELECGAVPLNATFDYLAPLKSASEN